LTGRTKRWSSAAYPGVFDGRWNEDEPVALDGLDIERMGEGSMARALHPAPVR
jgi:hypothetical protein